MTPKKRAWWRWPTALALCVPFLILAGLSAVLTRPGGWLLNAAEWLADVIDHLTTDD